MRAFILMAATLLLVPLVACGDDDDGSPDEWDTITSDAHQYSIDMPAGWMATTGEDDDTYAPPDDDDTTVLVEFGAGPEGPVDAAGFRATVIEAVQVQYGVDPVVLGVDEFGSREGLVVEWATEGTYATQAWVPNGDSSWYVTMTTSAGTKGDYDDTFQRMLDSFTPSD